MGYERGLGKTHVAGIQGYYKLYDRLFPLTMPCRIDQGWWTEQVGSQTRTRPSPPRGRKEAYGVEMKLERNRKETLHYSVAYAWSRSRREYTDGTWEPDEYDIPHALAVLTGVRLRKHHRIDLSIFAQSGRPGFEALSTDRDASAYRIFRLPDVYFLSAKYRYDIALRRTDITLFIEGYNLMNRTHRVAQMWDSWRGRYVDIIYDGFLPNAGVSVRF
jgi:hypothetical protein